MVNSRWGIVQRPSGHGEMELVRVRKETINKSVARKMSWYHRISLVVCEKSYHVGLNSMSPNMSTLPARDLAKRFEEGEGELKVKLA